MPHSQRSYRIGRTRVLALLAFGVLILASHTSCSGASTVPQPVTVTNYTDPAQAMAFGDRSHWKQPWRSYMDTVPASTLLNAVGINFNVKPSWADSTAKLLADGGFRRARFEIGWNNIDYDDPSQMTANGRATMTTVLKAMQAHGIRPLIDLNSNSGGPCPSKWLSLSLTVPANKGDTQVHLDPASPDFAKIVPGRSGLPDGSIMGGYLFTSVEPDGLATLSQPLKVNLPAGPLKESVILRYEPFHQATSSPQYEQTLQGWLNYVGVIAREARAILGSEEFDVEVWNELSFGSAFLNVNNYYQPDIEAPGDVTYGPNTILPRTVEYLRDPANGFPNIGIGNGFANERPKDSGSESPVGLTAIDKHPYHGWNPFPGTRLNNRPLNALGQPGGSREPSGLYNDDFTPHYDVFFPEYFLSGIQTETLVHDLSPVPSTIGQAKHGRFTHPKGGSAPAYWITEVNMDPAAGPEPEMSAQDVRHIESKEILRYLAAYVNKGVTAIDFYAANAGNLSLIDAGFFNALKAKPSAFPGDALGGETIDAVRRLTDSMSGAEASPSPRQLSLRELTDYSSNVQFEGDGTAAHAPLYNRDVFGFFPFQVDSNRFVIPVYVMTRNMAQVYPESGSGPSRFDLPPEPYKMAIGGVHGVNAKVTATDPLTGAAVPVEVISESADEIVVEMKVTDSPRLLSIEEQPGAEGEESAGGPAAGTGGEASPPGTGSSKPQHHSSSRNESSSMRLQLRVSSDPGSLIRTHKLTVVAECSETCEPQFTGRLKVGRQVFPMRAQVPQSRLAVSSTRAEITLAISSRAAIEARRALGGSSAVSASVLARTGTASTERKLHFSRSRR